jgi:hypothetical protein
MNIIDTNVQLTLYKAYISQNVTMIENCKTISSSCYKKVSFALLNGWNMTKTTVVLTTHEVGNGGILSLGPDL